MNRLKLVIWIVIAAASVDVIVRRYRNPPTLRGTIDSIVIDGCKEAFSGYGVYRVIDDVDSLTILRWHAPPQGKQGRCIAVLEKFEPEEPTAN